MSKVFMALQDVDEARSVVEAILADNPGAEVEHEPAMVRIVAQNKLVVKRETVSGILGRDWEPQDIQLILISFGGNLSEDDDQLTVYWN